VDAPSLDYFLIIPIQFEEADCLTKMSLCENVLVYPTHSSDTRRNGKQSSCRAEAGYKNDDEICSCNGRGYQIRHAGNEYGPCRNKESKKGRMTEQNMKTHGDFRVTFGAEPFNFVHLCAFYSHFSFLGLAEKAFAF